MGHKRKTDMKTPIILCVLAAAFVIFAETSAPKMSGTGERAAATETEETEMPQTETGTETGTETETEDPLKDYPASLVAFMKKYPEATEFVLDYPKYKNVHNKIDITGEVKRVSCRCSFSGMCVGDMSSTGAIFWQSPAADRPAFPWCSAV